MAKGISVSVGLNAVDPQHYQGWNGLLQGCEPDAQAMTQLLAATGFKTKTLLTKDATSAAVLQSIADAAQALGGGDIFVLTNSSHGGQLPDLNGDEPDGQDETWCMFDRQLVDDEIYAALGQFKKGVRVLVVSDSCHAGTSIRAAFYNELLRMPLVSLAHGPANGDSAQTVYKAMPLDLVSSVYHANAKVYDPILRSKLKESSKKGTLEASVLLLAACQDSQLSMDGPFNGLFTTNLLRAWNGGMFQGSYLKFYGSIKKGMPPTQVPNYFWGGVSDKIFEGQSPFSI
jgi:hypothetical protein